MTHSIFFHAKMAKELSAMPESEAMAILNDMKLKKGELNGMDQIEICSMMGKNKKGQQYYFTRELAMRWHFHRLEELKKSLGDKFGIHHPEVRQSFRDYEKLVDDCDHGNISDYRFRKLKKLPPTKGWVEYQECLRILEDESLSDRAVEALCVLKDAENMLEDMKADNITGPRMEKIEKMVAEAQKIYDQELAA
jgi:hypothetical protein